MSKVITFSRTFPSYHPRKGEPTYFVEKIWESLIQLEEISLSRCCELSRETGIGNYTMNSIRKINFDPKHHTIRAGHRFKVGDWFSPRVWSGKPYNSKQIIIAPDIQVKKVWNFEVKDHNIFLDGKEMAADLVGICARNDGLSFTDMMHWFKFPQESKNQIICWNKNIEYK
ncbi:MAG TPA: hypothetical protein VL443_30040 [Cyclobacteriaceae bacterium]|nr:hypothetical protein [Cyclobacteriaceae bacterium]